MKNFIDTSNLPDCCKYCPNNKNAFCNCTLPYMQQQSSGFQAPITTTGMVVSAGLSDNSDLVVQYDPISVFTTDCVVINHSTLK